MLRKGLMRICSLLAISTILISCITVVQTRPAVVLELEPGVMPQHEPGPSEEWTR